MGHRVLRVGREGTVDRDVRQRPVTGLPGDEREQGRRGRHVRLGRAADHVGPQPLVGRAVLMLHTRPGIVAYPQVRDGQDEPGQLVVVGDLAAAAVAGDRVPDRVPARVHQRPKAIRRARLRDHQRLRPPPRALMCPAHRIRLRPGHRRDRGSQRFPVGADRHPSGGQRGGVRVRRPVEPDPVRRAAVRILARVRPVPALVHPEQVAQRDGRAAGGGPERVGDGSDQSSRAVSRRDGRRDPALAHDVDSVLGDVA